MVELIFQEGNLDKEIDLYEASMLILDILVKMAVEHESTCSKPKKCENENVHALAEKSESYVWGSNSSHQLAEGVVEKIIVPTLSKAFAQAQQSEAGQYCTFIIQFNGQIAACGKGSYGRLGLGDSTNQQQPKRVRLDCKVKRLSSSKGSDGHTLAMTEDGQVYSWGDGDYGKLGHGNCTTEKEPKLVAALAGKVVK